MCNRVQQMCDRVQQMCDRVQEMCDRGQQMCDRVQQMSDRVQQMCDRIQYMRDRISRCVTGYRVLVIACCVVCHSVNVTLIRWNEDNTPQRTAQGHAGNNVLGFNRNHCFIEMLFYMSNNGRP